VANVNVRVPDELAARFDAWAGAHGGRSPALRHLMDTASAGLYATPHGEPLGPRPVKLTVRLRSDDVRGLGAAAAEIGLTPNAWAAALVRRRLAGAPTFDRAGALALLAIQVELRRIGVNVNQIARALNTAVMEGRILELQLDTVDDLRRELRAHVLALAEAVRGNLAYWEAEG